jgi:hypothetical protein
MAPKSTNEASHWRVKFSLALVLASVGVYALSWALFRDLRATLFDFVDNFAFLFIYVLVVVLVLEGVLARREKRSLIKKMNMVIGAFFSDVGLELLKSYPDFAANMDELGGELRFSGQWQKSDFIKAMETAKKFPFKIKVSPAALRDLRNRLCQHRSFLLRLLENPNLLEHDRFTDLLWSVFHLVDELELREGDFEGLPEADYLHLAGDIKRAYSHLTGEWLAYAMHLKESYPFLFSLVVRINPFAPSPSPIVREK